MRFLFDPKYMKYKGFETIDTANSYFELMYLTFDKNLNKPYFKNTVKEQKSMTNGFILYYTNQCPFTAKYVSILEKIAKIRKVDFNEKRLPKIINLERKFNNMGKAYDGIIGLVVGDALGLPVQFKKRDTYKITDMVGNGTYNQPLGTWSDDSSMTLATVESIGRLGKIDTDDIMKNFLDWLNNATFTPYNKVFDVGARTLKSIAKYARGVPIDDCGGKSYFDNGNGALMRILPVAIAVKEDVAIG